MKRLFRSLSGVLLALPFAACSSQPSATPHHGGSAGSSSGTGGTAVDNTGGISFGGGGGSGGRGAAGNPGGGTPAKVSVLTSGTADLTVDANTKYQRWDGFGGCFNEMGWDALSVVSSEIPRAMKLLFDANDGANFVYGRLPLGASDYSMSWYTL